MTTARAAALPVEVLDQHPDNPPERVARDRALGELADSITAAGVLQPLLVEPDGTGRYVVIAGNRRLAAARLAGRRTVPCVIRGQHPRLEHHIVRVIENGHRRGLSPLQQAHAFDQLRRDGLSQTQIAARTGYSASHVSNRLALLDLDQTTQQAIQEGRLQPEAALAAVRQTRCGPHRQQPRPRRGGYLSGSHPLAGAVAERCTAEHGRAGTRVGGVGCGRCWEQVIRADERAQLAGEEPDYAPILDEVAIERAMAGERVALTHGERVEAARRLRVRGASAAATGAALGMTGRNAVRLAPTSGPRAAAS
jgi:ParB family chromosome partitioning protein